MNLKKIDKEHLDIIVENWKSTGLLADMPENEARLLATILEKTADFLLNDFERLCSGTNINISIFPCIHRIFRHNNFKSFSIIPVVKSYNEFYRKYNEVYHNNELHLNRHGKNRDAQVAMCVNFCEIYSENLKSSSSPKLLIDVMKFYPD